LHLVGILFPHIIYRISRTGTEKNYKH